MFGLKRITVARHERALVFRNRSFKTVLEPGLYWMFDPLGRTDVQVYDDRGRPVRTTYDEGHGLYWFPEAAEPWSFVSRTDADGRARWNVYPLRGAPTSQFTYADDGVQVLPVGTNASTPPWPFAKAPALDAPADAAIGAEGATPSPTPAP